MFQGLLEQDFHLRDAVFVVLQGHGVALRIPTRHEAVVMDQHHLRVMQLFPRLAHAFIRRADVAEGYLFSLVKADRPFCFHRYTCHATAPLGP